MMTLRLALKKSITASKSSGEKRFCVYGMPSIQLLKMELAGGNEYEVLRCVI